MHLFIDHRVIGHQFGKSDFLARIGQFAMEQQVASFQKVAIGRQLLNGVATVEQLALVAVDVSDGRFARGG